MICNLSTFRIAILLCNSSMLPQDDYAIGYIKSLIGLELWGDLLHIDILHRTCVMQQQYVTQERSCNRLLKISYRFGVMG